MTFEEYVASLGFLLMEDGRFMAPDGESFYDADQMRQMVPYTEPPPPEPFQVNGKTYIPFTVDPGDADRPEYLRQEASMQRAYGIGPGAFATDPKTGMRGLEQNSQEAIDNFYRQKNSQGSIFDYGPILLPTLMTPAIASSLAATGAAAGSAALPESYWSATAGLDTGTAASVGGGAATTPAALPAITPEYIASGIGPSTTLTSGFTGGAGLSLADLARIPTIPQGVKDAAGVAGGAGTLATLARQQEVDGSAQSIYDAAANAGIEGYDPSLVSGVSGIGVNPGTVTFGSAAKTALGKLLSGTPLSEDELGKLLGTLGSTALGVAGGMDQANAIREANDKNAVAFAAAQQRAMATLTEAQKQALQSSGAGKEEAIKAYKASLAEAVRYNEQALKSGVSGFESGRDAAIKASTDALASGLGYNEKALGKSLSELQTTRDQSLAMSNAARDTSIAALEDAKNKALSTLTESQRQALATSGAGRDEAIAAYENALKVALSTSGAAKAEGMGILQAAQAGALGANRGTEDRYFGIGAPARARLEASYQPGFSMSNEPGYKDAIDQVMNSYLRKASVGGNPFENPGVSMEANKYVTAGTALPQLNTYRTQLNQFGNQGLDTAGSAGLQRPGIYSSLGALQSNLAGDFGRFDAGMIDRSGANVAGVNERTSQNDANLISGTGRAGAEIYRNLGALQSGVASDFGKFNAGLSTTAGTNIANITSRAGEFGTNLISDTGRNVAGAAERAGTNIGGANLTAGQYNTGLIDRSGANVAGANITAGQGDAALIANIGRTGAGVLGQTFNSVPASNSGAFNAGAFGLNQLTNPAQDYSSVLAEINARIKALSQKGFA